MAIWVHHYDPEMKRIHGMTPSDITMLAEVETTTFMASMFWDKEGILLVDFLGKGTSQLRVVQGNFKLAVTVHP
jgi:hypothetical protein